MKNIKAKIMISDGIWAAMAILHPSKVGTKEICKNDVIGVKKCSTKFVNKEG